METETPGANELSLSCTNCTNPNATAIAASAGCQSYDFEVHTSYNGFLSDPFYIFINRPWSTVAASDKVGGTWVYSIAYGDGYDTHINYKTLSLCSTDAAMSTYDINEQFTSSWSLTNSAYNWLAASATGASVPADGQWFDDVNFYSSASNCSALPCNPAPSNPGVGPHNLVEYASQSWFVGSQTSGVGARIQTDVLQRYTDSAWHDQITTPAP